MHGLHAACRPVAVSFQELWGLLVCNRQKKQELGRIPCVNHTDHANIARLDGLDLSRTEPKHLRWWQEITEGGSLLWHRPGKGVMHTAPDGLSRNPPGRDRLILAQQKDWIDFRARIQGLQKARDDKLEAAIAEYQKRNGEKGSKNMVTGLGDF